jgi:hypothetical protein
MNDLAAALTIVRERIAKWRGQLIVEENTKTVLIEPILRALGWGCREPRRGAKGISLQERR